MRPLLLAFLTVGCATAWIAKAQDVDGRQGLSEDEAKQRQSVIEKYDADGDGVLNKSEQKKLSKADKKTLAQTGGVGTARKAPQGDVQKAEKKKDEDPKQSPDKRKGSEGHDDAKASKESKAEKGSSGGNGKPGKK
jgi:hypothetical protein